MHRRIFPAGTVAGRGSGTTGAFRRAARAADQLGDPRGHRLLRALHAHKDAGRDADRDRRGGIFLDEVDRHWACYGGVQACCACSSFQKMVQKACAGLSFIS